MRQSADTDLRGAINDVVPAATVPQSTFKSRSEEPLYLNHEGGP
jgi:hypothetical protein